jgi:hypothetical protein
MNLDRILTSAPINHTAARVVSSPRNPVPMGDLTRAELIALMDRLQRKHRLLKVVLGITKKSQAKNLTYMLKGMQKGLGKRGSGVNRVARDPRAALELIRVGDEIQRMNRRLQELKAAQTGKSVVQHGWETA